MVKDLDTCDLFEIEPEEWFEDMPDCGDVEEAVSASEEGDEDDDDAVEDGND